MYRNVSKNIFQNVGKCTKKTILKVIRVGKGTLDVILSQINKKIGDRFHFHWYRRRVYYQFFNYVTDKVNGARVQPSSLRGGLKTGPGRRWKSSLLSSLRVFLNDWLNSRVRNQFDIKTLIAQGHSDINTTPSVIMSLFCSRSLCLCISLLRYHWLLFIALARSACRRFSL